jgi:hypothetical protein
LIHSWATEIPDGWKSGGDEGHGRIAGTHSSGMSGCSLDRVSAAGWRKHLGVVC